MKHVTFADKHLLLDDTTADLLLEYAAVLANGQAADTVEVTAYGMEGRPVRARLLLAPGSPLMSESSTSELPDPDNLGLIDDLRRRIARRVSPPPVGPEHADHSPVAYDDLDL